MTLTEFLLARIAEDEAAAILAEAAPPHWSMTVWPHDGDAIAVQSIDRTFAPARVLAEVAAKCTQIAVLREMDESGGPEARSYAYSLLCRMTLPYANHPDYDEAWRP